LTLLERLRCDRGLTQLEVEQATGINHRTLVKYESGVSDRVSFASLAKLGAYYNVPASLLLQDLRRAVRERENRDRLARDAA
jgi:transcriptional regulator with XRE-family HTH domain